MAWTNRDKLCTAWLQSLPGPEGFSNPEFTEALALTLCMPSPACKDRVGEKVGKSVVDVFGDSIMSEPLPGGWYQTLESNFHHLLENLKLSLLNSKFYLAARQDILQVQEIKSGPQTGELRVFKQNTRRKPETLTKTPKEHLTRAGGQ